jgi:DNA-binding transcriptional ArsR family regulator
MELFTALADPTRRWILARLRAAGPLSIGDLARDLPMSRQAVTKHLDNLATSGLVVAQRRGRERLHRLEAGPLAELDDWLEPYRDSWRRRLARLERHLSEETDHDHD